MKIGNLSFCFSGEWYGRGRLQCVAQPSQLVSPPLCVDPACGATQWNGSQKCRDDAISWTEAGLELARKYVREHRLWEMYLIAHADVAPSRVDHDADAIEHVLEPEMIAELETLLADQDGVQGLVPPDPHAPRLHPPAPHLPQ